MGYMAALNPSLKSSDAVCSVQLLFNFVVPQLYASRSLLCGVCDRLKKMPTRPVRIPQFLGVHKLFNFSGTRELYIRSVDGRGVFLIVFFYQAASRHHTGRFPRKWK